MSNDLEEQNIVPLLFMTSRRAMRPQAATTSIPPASDEPIITGRLSGVSSRELARNSMAGEGPSFSKSANIPEVDVSTPIGPEIVSKPAKPTLPEPLEVNRL
ncbi:hypothetical protein Bca4012_093909 [Brassica carinata]